MVLGNLILTSKRNWKLFPPKCSSQLFLDFTDHLKRDQNEIFNPFFFSPALKGGKMY